MTAAVAAPVPTVGVAAVVFDFYGTLTPGRTGDEQSRARAEQAAVLGVDRDRFDEELSATFDDRCLGAGGSVAGSLEWVSHRIGARPTAEQLERAAQLRLTAERRFGEPRPDAPEVLHALRERGLRIGVLSNCTAELPAYFADLPIAPFVDTAVFSFTSRLAKPDPRIYRECCAQLGVAPEDCLFVGDGGSDELPGARAVGMRAIHLAVPAEASGVVYDRHDSWDGESVASLGEVLDLV